MSAIEDCRKKRGEEMKEGYYNLTIDKTTGNMIKIWISDTRKTYFSAVESLKILLAPEIKSDNKISFKDATNMIPKIIFIINII